MRVGEVAAFLVISLVVGFVLQFLEITNSWANTPSYVLMGIVGFVLAYHLFWWIFEEEKIGFVQKPLFFPILIVGGILAYITAVAFYFQNNFMLSGQTPFAALASGFDRAFANWLPLLHQDPYLQLLIGIAFAWVAFFVFSKRQ